MKRQKKINLQSSKGITLIALVVTIIVLIILAVISINIVFGEDGIIARARTAQEAQKMADAKEKVQLMVADYLIEREISVEEITLLDYMTEQKDKGNLDSVKEETRDEKEKVVVETGGYEIEIDKETLEVEIAGEGETNSEGSTETQEPETSTAVAGVEIKQSHIGIGVDDTLTLMATIEPATAINKNVTWTSNDNSVVTVSDDGVVTGINKGNATITVTTEDGNKTATCNVVVGTLVTTLTSIQGSTQNAIDRLGNPVTIPGGFRYVEGELVQNGIVIEDNNTTTYTDGTTMGNQFVWIPVSNIDGGTDTTKNKTIKVEDETTKEVTEVEITLGRYTFEGTYNSETKLIEGTGKEELVQPASEWDAGQDTKYGRAVGNYLGYELSSSNNPEGLESEGEDGMNAIYQTLETFVGSVEECHGYYIGRYEASCESGTTFGVGTNSTYYKPASKKSSNVIADEWEAESGRLWNCLTQLNASKVARNMYNANDGESTYVVSDLVNSYMWDTAIVFIQAMGNSNYANANRNVTGNNYKLLNTGETGDVKCNIYDMAANVNEWTTEYSTCVVLNQSYPCIARGGDSASDKQGTCSFYSPGSSRGYDCLHISYRF